jgi:hypothetical protein
MAHSSFWGLALDLLHHEVVGTDFVNLADVGMVQRRDGLGFAFVSFIELRGGDFDCHISIQARVARAIHLADAARSDGRKNFAWTESVAGGERR